MIILDTHVWVWLASDPGRLSAKARKKIEGSRRRGLAAISCWEFAMLIQKGRISIDRSPIEWIERSLDQLGIELLPLTPAVAVQSTQLGRGFAGDPADRLIVATATIQSAPRVTKDERIRRYEAVETVW